MSATTGSVSTEADPVSVDVVTTVNGGYFPSLAILRAGGLVGLRSDNQRPPMEVPIEFVDWPFEDGAFTTERWERHLQLVTREEPRLAVAPDANENIDYGRVLEYADELRKVAGTVIVVPKAVHPSEVPDEYRVGMPCQERFGPTPWPWPEYQHAGPKGVHLLGGSPSKHAEIRRYYIPIRSLDTASVVKSAHFGSYWQDGGWNEGDFGMYPTLERSVRGMVEFFNEKPPSEFTFDLPLGMQKKLKLPATEPLSDEEWEDIELAYRLAGARGARAPCMEPDCTDPMIGETSYCTAHQRIYI